MILCSDRVLKAYSEHLGVLVRLAGLDHTRFPKIPDQSQMALDTREKSRDLEGILRKDIGSADVTPWDYQYQRSWLKWLGLRSSWSKAIIVRMDKETSLRGL